MLLIRRTVKKFMICTPKVLGCAVIVDTSTFPVTSTALDDTKQKKNAKARKLSTWGGYFRSPKNRDPCNDAISRLNFHKGKARALLVHELKEIKLTSELSEKQQKQLRCIGIS